MKAFCRDGFLGVVAENAEERDFINRILHRCMGASASVREGIGVRINGCNHPDGISVALTLHPYPPMIEYPTFIPPRAQDCPGCWDSKCAHTCGR